MSRPNIVLTGFMGTGKSTVGRLAARKLGYEFVDTDHLIEARAGSTIPEIFSKEGEEAFRQMERAIAAELGRREGLVIATGGRLMLDPANAAALGHQGRVFCLVATPEEILKRVSGDGPSQRPLLAVENPMQRILSLLKERKQGYARFSQLTTTGRSPEELTSELVDRFRAGAGPAD